MKKLLFASFLASGFFLTSCGGDGSPEITISSEKSISIAADSVFTVAGTATDDNGLATLNFANTDLGLDFDLGGGDFPALTGGAFSKEFDLSPDPAEGTYTIDITATDDEGNTSTDAISLEIKN